MRTPQDFFGKKQTKYCKSRVYESMNSFNVFFIEPTKKYLVILFISSFRNTLFGSHFFEPRSAILSMQGLIDLGPIHTSATSRATEKKKVGVACISCQAAA